MPLNIEERLKRAFVPFTYAFTRPPTLTSNPTLASASTSQASTRLRADAAYVEECEEERARVRRRQRAARVAEEGGRATQGGMRITKERLMGWGNRDCISRFRLRPDEILELHDALDLPALIRTRNRYIFSSLEALCLTLARFRSTADQAELSRLYDRSQSAISEVVNFIVLYIDTRWHHLLEFDHNVLLTPANLEVYAEAIHRLGAPTDTVWGFIDCTIRRICRPGRWQRQAYNGHKKYHALKFQAIVLPNGILIHLFGPQEGRRNDLFLLTESRILDLCEKYAMRPETDEQTPAEHRFLQIFGDAAYDVSPQILGPFEKQGRTAEQTEWNKAMSSVRIDVEHIFGIVVNDWPFLNAYWKQRLYQSPVGAYYRTGVLFTNALNCLRPNQISQRFDLEPPLLSQYFHD